VDFALLMGIRSFSLRPAHAHRIRLAPTGAIAVRRAALRLRLIFVLTVLALPLGAAVIAIGRSAAASEREKADARLGSALQGALQQYTGMLNQAELHALKLANSARVRQALRDSNRVALSRFARADPYVSFYRGGTRLAGSEVGAGGRRSVSVTAGGRSLGRVVVTVPFDAANLAELKRNAGLRSSERLLVLHGRYAPGGVGTGASRAQTLRLGRSRYRALTAPLLTGRSRTTLLVLTAVAPIEAAATTAERRIFLAGLGTLLFFVVLAYALAPAIARARNARQQRAQAARILSHVGDGVFLVDGDGVIRFWNTAAELIAGLPAGLVEGRVADEAIAGWAAAKALVPVSAGLRDSNERARAVTVPLRLETRELWLSVSGVEFSEGTVYVFRDLTEERRLEAMRRDVVATVSHELRTPLASVHGAALTLRRQSALSEQHREQLLGVLVDESDRLAQLVEQILLASQLDAGVLPTLTERFDLGELAHEVLEASRSHAPAEVELELVAAPSLPAAIGDPDKARQVLTNLIENAIKYSPDGGKVELDLDLDDGRMRLAVRDHGLGIPSGERERVFEKFYRLDPHLRRGIGGTGLGLYISRELVSRMQGKIWVESQEGIGSTFYVELPAAS
jgi:two-component system phosphate regulon sensor histidine kinase PhoR